MSLPALIPLDDIRERLKVIFPEGVPERSFLIRLATARTVFVALYVGAVEGGRSWIAPRYVYRMSDEQAARHDDSARLAYLAAMEASKALKPVKPWYADTTREPVRDEAIRQGLVPVNAMIEQEGLATTSRHGRYALRRDFADLFRPSLQDAALEAEAAGWRARHLSPGALARTALVRVSASTASANIAVQCPKGPSIILPPGPSTTITKAVVEDFSKTFLGDPRVAWVSDSKMKEVFRNAPLETSLRIKLNVASLLPDVVLVDVQPPGRPNGILIVFVEVVASDGPVNEQRQRALLKLLADSPGAYSPDDAAFVTAYRDRGSAPARRTIPSLAWRSFAWFASEPDKLIQLHDGSTAAKKLAALL